MDEIKINVIDQANKVRSNDFKGYYAWHNVRTFEVENNAYSKLTCSDSFGGCGMQQLYGWRDVQNDYASSNALIKKYLETKHRGVGLVICQLGQQYYGSSFEKALIDNGFTSTIEYNNLQHGKNYTQKIYTKTFIE